MRPSENTITSWLKSGWVALLLASITFIAAYGQQKQQVADLDAKFANYVPRVEYQTLYTQHAMMMRDLTTISANLNLLIQQEARLHGQKFQTIPPLPQTSLEPKNAPNFKVVPHVYFDSDCGVLPLLRVNANGEWERY